MKMFLVLVFVGLLVLILVNRQRVYVRDPIASVYGNGAKQSGVQVFINYANDVLLEQDEDPGSYRILVQHGSKMPGTPAILGCLRWMVCLTDADVATTLPMDWSGKGRYEPKVSMTSREVSFVGGDGVAMRVTLR